jgi:hypothetical protein
MMKNYFKSERETVCVRAWAVAKLKNSRASALPHVILQKINLIGFQDYSALCARVKESFAETVLT